VTPFVELHWREADDHERRGGRTTTRHRPTPSYTTLRDVTKPLASGTRRRYWPPRTAQRLHARSFMALQPASAASGTRTLSTRAGRRKPETAASASLSAAKPEGPARRADPRVRARSLTGDQSPCASTAPFHSTALFDTPLLGFTRARGYQIRLVDVKRARFVCRAATRSRLITPDSRAKPSLRPIELIELNPRTLTEFLNPTGCGSRRSLRFGRSDRSRR
jgi:hypothetical protein